MFGEFGEEGYKGNTRSGVGMTGSVSMGKRRPGLIHVCLSSVSRVRRQVLGPTKWVRREGPSDDSVVVLFVTGWSQRVGSESGVGSEGG